MQPMPQVTEGTVPISLWPNARDRAMAELAETEHLFVITPQTLEVAITTITHSIRHGSHVCDCCLRHKLMRIWIVCHIKTVQIFKFNLD